MHRDTNPNHLVVPSFNPPHRVLLTSTRQQVEGSQKTIVKVTFHTSHTSGHWLELAHLARRELGTLRATRQRMGSKGSVLSGYGAPKSRLSPTNRLTPTTSPRTRDLGLPE